MSKYQQLLKDQSRVKVAAYAEKKTTNTAWWAMFAFAFAGVFYFFSGTLWRALIGG